MGSTERMRSALPRGIKSEATGFSEIRKWLTTAPPRWLMPCVSACLRYRFSRRTASPKAAAMDKIPCPPTPANIISVFIFVITIRSYQFTVYSLQFTVCKVFVLTHYSRLATFFSCVLCLVSFRSVLRFPFFLSLLTISGFSPPCCTLDALPPRNNHGNIPVFQFFTENPDHFCVILF